MSKFSPRYFILIAEHSICHPGLPLPHGLFHTGSISENFHTAKSNGSFFDSSISILEPDCSSSIFFFDNFPYPGNFETEKYTPFFEGYAICFSINFLINSIISLICSVALG